MFGGIGEGVLRILRKPPDEKGNSRTVIQVRQFLFFWRDMYPVVNATRALQHEAVEIYDRLLEIVNTEIPEAKAWQEDFERRAIIECHERTGKSEPFLGETTRPEREMSNNSDRYKGVKAAFEGGAPRKKRSFAGPTTDFTLPQNHGKHDQIRFLDETDAQVEYRPPSHQSNQSQKGGGKGGGHQGKSQGGWKSALDGD